MPAKILPLQGQLSRRALIQTSLGLASIAGKPLWGAVLKLYLKDGTYQLAREYQIAGDRVRFYSTDRSDWEEIPLNLVDLSKTEAEIKQRAAEREAEAKADAAEAKAERDLRRQIARIPPNPGVYLISADDLKPLRVAEAKVVNNKGRHVLKMLSPLPLITDKSLLELDGAHAATVLHEARPEFYFRLSEEERFGMVRMGSDKGNRVVEKLTIIPVTKEIVEEPVLVETFRQQVGDMLYKIWPEKPLAAGEYALVEYTEGKVNMQVWDFACSPQPEQGP